MSRRRFLGYTLINPRIRNWQHGQGDYASSEGVENSMQLEYEAVTYSGGTVSIDTPKGFAKLHYDTTPSPLTVAGGGVSNIFGEGGVLDGLEQIFGDISSETAFDSPGNFLSTTIKTINTYENIKGLGKDQLKQEAVNILTSPAGIAGAASVITGIGDVVFPKKDPASETTEASPKTLVGD
jgi:hypothetical protein